MQKASCSLLVLLAVPVVQLAVEWPLDKIQTLATDETRGRWSLSDHHGTNQARSGELPTISSVKPLSAAPSAVIAVSGYGLGLDDRGTVSVIFSQEDAEWVAEILGSGYALSSKRGQGVQYMDVEVPPKLSPGQWQLVVDANGRRSAPVTVEIIRTSEVVLNGISPQEPHPAQVVRLTIQGPPQVDDRIDLTDARGTQWRIATGAASDGLDFAMPDDVTDGEATVRVVRTVDLMETFSAPFRFFIAAGPLPLKADAITHMKPVAPGQWTDLAQDHEIEFELRRADRVELEYRQGDRMTIVETTGAYREHVHVPAHFAPGLITVRTRTWMDGMASEWSTPTPFRALERPVAPTVILIKPGEARDSVWLSGSAPATYVVTRPGETLVLRGHFPVANAADLRIRLEGSQGTFDLPATDVGAGVRIEVPVETAVGDWLLSIATTDSLMPLRHVTVLRIR